MNRAIWALAKKTFGKSNQLKTNVTSATFVIAICFILSFLAIFASYAQYFFRGNVTADYLSAENCHVLVYNAPDSFRSFLASDTNSDESYERSIRYATIDAYYDVFEINAGMKENDAVVAIVFPSDFEEKIANISSDSDERPEILTYMSDAHLEYADIHENLEDVLLRDYNIYLLSEKDVPIAERNIFATDNWAVSYESDTTLEDSFFNMVAHMIIPFLFFVLILYVGMCSGMNAIAGEKERGTFAGILMTPISRLSIVLGNLLGVWLHALLPSLIFVPAILIVPQYRTATAILATVMLLATLSLFVASLTILVSILNHSIISAQTTFLPIFLILLVVCVTCMQETDMVDRIYLIMPIYGHYHGIALALTGQFSWVDGLICTGITLAFIVIIICACEQFLQTERFTTTIDAESAKDLKKARDLIEKQKTDYIVKPKASVFGYAPKQRTKPSRFLLWHAFLPLALLSIFQPIALIPSILSFMSSAKSTEFVQIFKDLQNLTDIADALQQSANLFSQFMKDPTFIWMMSVSYFLIIGVYLLIVKKAEKNPLSTLGFPNKTGNKHHSPLLSYARGLGVGLLMISSVYGILAITGQIELEGFSLSLSSLPLFLGYIAMWIPQGASEEVMLRGYAMPRLAARFGVPFGIFFSSVLFSILHAGNVGFSFLAFSNLILIAVFFALLAYYTKQIYTVAAAHTIWNFAQGNLFGLQVSGSKSAASVLSTVYSEKATSLMTGGDFGPEGGLAVTIVSVIALLLLVALRNKIKCDLNSKESLLP